MVWSLTELTESELEAIRTLEKELGINVLAFENFDVEPADISKNDLKEIENLEDKLGMSLLAVEK